MDPRLQRRVQRYGWDKASAWYETFWQDQLRPAQDLLLEMAGLRPGESVLDVACGTGLVSRDAVARVGSEGKVLGTDISEKMVEVAAAAGAGFGAGAGAGSGPGAGFGAEPAAGCAQFMRMDAEELSLDRETFDVALCALGLMYMPDPRKALEEMRRVLKPGGRAVAAVWGQRDRCGWADIFEIVDRHVASEVCPMFFSLGNPDMLELHFTAAGFTEVVVRRISTVLHYADAREALGAAFEGGPVALAYHKFSDAVKEEVHADYLRSIDAFRKGGGYAVPGEFVVAGGRRATGDSLSDS